MADILKAGHATRLGLIRVHREGIVAAPAWVYHVIGAATDRARCPHINDIKYQGRVYLDGRM